MSSSRVQRLVRGAVTATFATFVALAGHALGGGAMPGPVGLAAPLVLSVAICTFLSGRRLSLPRLTASVAVAQSLFHALFVLGAPGATVRGHHHSSEREAALGLNSLPLADADASAGSAMWIGHALALVVTSAALFWAERVLTALAVLAERMRSRVLRSLTVHSAALPVLATLPSISIEVARPHVGARVSRASRRGPPFLSA